MLKHLSKNFKPLFDCVLVKRYVVPGKSAGGLLLPNAPKVNEGTVVAVGPGVRGKDGISFLPLELQVGDGVILPQYGGIDLKFEDGDAALFRFEEILGVTIKLDI